MFFTKILAKAIEQAFRGERTRLCGSDKTTPKDSPSAGPAILLKDLPNLMDDIDPFSGHADTVADAVLLYRKKPSAGRKPPRPLPGKRAFPVEFGDEPLRNTPVAEFFFHPTSSSVTTVMTCSDAVRAYEKLKSVQRQFADLQARFGGYHSDFNKAGYDTYGGKENCVNGRSRGPPAAAALPAHVARNGANRAGQKPERRGGGGGAAAHVRREVIVPQPAAHVPDWAVQQHGGREVIVPQPAGGVVWHANPNYGRGPQAFEVNGIQYGVRGNNQPRRVFHY
jgi:hypothetical protein